MEALLEQISQHADQAAFNGWRMSTLGACCEKPEYGVTASASPVPVGPRFLRITDIQDGLVDWNSVPYCDAGSSIDEKKFLRKNDIVIARIGATTGKAFLVEDCPPAIFASYLIRVRANEQHIDPRFLYYFLQTSSYWQHIDKHKDDRLKGGVNIPILASLSLPLPSTDDQVLIAQSLSLAQKGIALEKKAQLATEQLKRITMQTLFTRGLRSEAQKATEIGPMPDSWQVEPLGAHFSAVSGGTPSRANASYWIGGTLPWVKTTEIDYCVIQQTEEHITEEGLNNSAAKLLPAGTLLLAMYGQGVTRGKVAILGIDATCNQACAALRPRDEAVLTRYLYHFLTSRYDTIRQLAHGGQQQNLNLDIVRAFPVAYPANVAEQQEIIDIIDAIDRKIDLHKRKRAVLAELFSSLLHSLMTGEIQVSDLDLSALNPPPATEAAV